MWGSLIMLIAGAGRHAKDLYVVLKDNSVEDDFYFYDDTTTLREELFLGRYKVIISEHEASQYFLQDNKFAIGVGGVNGRRILYKKLIKLGGGVISVISKRSIIGCNQYSLGQGLNIMPYVFVSEAVKIGQGTLLNTRVSVHHDVEIGDFCDVAPGALLLGGVKVGNFSFIGANSTILPDVEIGVNCIVGAGAVVTKNVPDNSKVLGVPARIVDQNLNYES